MTRSSIWNKTLETVPLEHLFEKVEEPLLYDQLQYVLARSPLYRETFRGLGDANDLLKMFSSLPLTNKQDILTDQERHPPYGSNLCVGSAEIQRIHRTSGTTNRPFLIALTPQDIKDTVECGARCFWASGLRPEDTVLHCLNYCLWMGGYTDHQSLERTGATVVPFGVGNSRYLIDMMLEIRPSAIHCTPSYLSTLELLLRKEFRKSPVDLGIKKGFFGGEAGISEKGFRDRVEETWGLKAMNANYGLADVLSMFGAECEVREGLHFMGQGTLYVELMDPGTDETIPLQTGSRGELVLTNLKRQAQPLVRYQTGDLVEIVSSERCDCGRGGFRFRVIGRRDDMIVVKGINVFPNAVGNLLSQWLDDLTGEYQILVPATDPINRALLRVEVLPGVSRQRKETLSRLLRDQMKSSLSFQPDLVFVEEGKLPRTQGKSKRVLRVRDLDRDA